jgi:hypothetical protein
MVLGAICERADFLRDRLIVNNNVSGQRTINIRRNTGVEQEMHIRSDIFVENRLTSVTG